MKAKPNNTNQKHNPPGPHQQLKSHEEARAYYATHREERLAYQRAYYATHREKRRDYNAAHRKEIRAYRSAHREEKRAYQRAYYAAHRKKIRSTLKR